MTIYHYGLWDLTQQKLQQAAEHGSPFSTKVGIVASAALKFFLPTQHSLKEIDRFIFLKAAKELLQQESHRMAKEEIHKLAEEVYDVAVDTLELGINTSLLALRVRANARQLLEDRESATFARIEAES